MMQQFPRAIITGCLSTLVTTSRIVVVSSTLLVIGVTATGAQPPASAPAASVAPFEVPAWAFPLSTAPSRPFDSVTMRRVPGSGASFTTAQAQNRFGVADWFPRGHAPMPDVVVKGRKPAVIACGFCHLPDGMGRPENAMLAGLPAEYILAQLGELRARTRGSASPTPYRLMVTMHTIADSLRDGEAEDAARYFSHLRGHRRSRVVEATEIPRVTAAVGLYERAKEGGTEPLGRRLIEAPVDMARHELHDPRTEYIAWVPRGSLARGRALVTRGAEGVTSCASCHGVRLQGAGTIPPIAGQSPSYVLRQLLAFRTGARSSVAGGPMRTVASMLSLDDMIAAAAYVGSREP